jgi:HAD superfamily hydrolase (TIGR01509 family)
MSIPSAFAGADVIKPVRALIFDFDGLIVDSESPGFQAWSELYATHGCSLPFDKYSACIGTIGGFDLHAYLEEQSGRSFDRGELENACNERWLDLMQEQPLLPGIASCVSMAKARGLKLGIASSSTQAWVTRNLRKFGLLDEFDAVCTRDYVDAVKPDPELYLLALKKLEVSADEAIAFEDSPNGILAAKRAGIFCVAVPNPLTKDLPLDLADRRLSSLAEFELDDVCRLRSQERSGELRQASPECTDE